MSVLDKFRKKEDIMQKTIEIECDIFEKVEYLSNHVYDATISRIINECIDELIEKENIKMYPKKEGEISTKHSLMLRKSSLEGLDVIAPTPNLNVTLILGFVSGISKSYCPFPLHKSNASLCFPIVVGTLTSLPADTLATFSPSR